MIATLIALLRPYWLPLAVAAVLLGWVGALKVELWHAESQTEAARAATVVAEQDKQRVLATYATTAATAASAALAETSRRITDQAEAANESQRFVIHAAADAAMRRTADDRLRSATATTAARCSAGTADTAPAAVSPAASSPGDLLAYVQRRMGEAAGGVVEYADGLRASGGECASDYEALRK